MGYTLLTPVDNTKLDAFVDEAYTKGVSEYNRLYLPNEGIDPEGNTVHYLPYGAISVQDKVAVDPSHIFAVNGFLIKPGVIVEKYYIAKQQSGMILGDEKYFRVIESNTSVGVNSLVIVMAGQGVRFNINKREYFYVQPDKILIALTESGIVPGPSNMLLKHVIPEILGMGIDNPNKGAHGGNTYYFSDGLYDIVISNEKYSVVAIKDILLVD